MLLLPFTKIVKKTNMALDKDALNSLRMDSNARSEAPAGVGKWLPVVAAAALIVLALAWFFGFTGPAPVVETVVARAPATNGGNSRGTILHASGYVVARRLATVSSKVTGKIMTVLVEEGMAVTAGDILAQLDDSTVRARLALAAGQTDAARSSLAETRVRLEEAQRKLKRNESLREQKLVSAAELDAAQSEVNAFQARLLTDRSNVAVAQRNQDLIEQDLDDLTIRAPFSGVVVSKNAQPGEMISPISAGGGSIRTGICTIVDMDSLEIEVEVNEAYINRVSSGQRTEATLDAYPDWTISSQVINIVPTADRQKATVKVRIRFDELDSRVLPDMGVKVRFLESSQDIRAGEPKKVAAVALLPAAAVHESGGAKFVWIVKDGELERRGVSVGIVGNGMVGILTGVRPGEVVVSGDPEGLSAGMPVRVQK
ncbi:MAG: efflux RND transporter periplasmic adaptor subunit [Gammaproteobacteria bacterium]